ncbi:MAG: hypothetical protein K0S39_5010 [Paenibacillus sp.]|jgi:hypothetical protein|nr:hypothetical protein [Paenibacillus sp.]
MRVPAEENVENRDPLWPCISSVRCMDDKSLFAVTLGEGIYRKNGTSPWVKADRGLPDNCKINRLQLINRFLFACTSQGLFQWSGECWEETGLTVPCYQLISENGYLSAATLYGVWCGEGKRWVNAAAPRSIVYDLWSCPDYLILGTDQGISIYDRYTYAWVHFPQEAAVTGLAVYQSSLLGVTEKGDLILGDQQGGFSKASFPDLYLYSVYSSGGEVYICSERGLFQLDFVSKRFMLRSLSTGRAVTDIDICGERIYMATMCHGIQQFER